MLPTRVEGLAHQTVTEVATAESHTVALTSSGAVFSWGRDRFGQVLHKYDEPLSHVTAVWLDFVVTLGG